MKFLINTRHEDDSKSLPMKDDIIIDNSNFKNRGYYELSILCFFNKKPPEGSAFNRSNTYISNK